MIIPRLFNYVFLIAIIAMMTAYRLPKGLEPQEGYIKVSGGKIWYRIIGGGNNTPILMLHGGPGFPSYYLKPLEALGKDRPIIFFDQLGCGRSDRITDTSLMTIDHFTDEVNEVVRYLGLKEYYLYGQSWGTMLGTDFYLKRPKGIKALILSSPALSIPLWLKDADTLVSTLPAPIQKIIRTSEQNNTMDAPEYQRAILVYYEKFFARKLPWPADLDSCFLQAGNNIYEHMVGEGELVATGNLKNYDRTNRLAEIKIPVLFITGEFDQARPSTVRYYQSLIQGSRFSLIENSGHLTTLDNPGKNIEVISSFLKEIENN